MKIFQINLGWCKLAICDKKSCVIRLYAKVKLFVYCVSSCRRISTVLQGPFYVELVALSGIFFEQSQLHWTINCLSINHSKLFVSKVIWFLLNYIIKRECSYVIFASLFLGDSTLFLRFLWQHSHQLVLNSKLHKHFTKLINFSA